MVQKRLLSHSYIILNRLTYFLVLWTELRASDLEIDNKIKFIDFVNKITIITNNESIVQGPNFRIAAPIVQYFTILFSVSIVVEYQFWTTNCESFGNSYKSNWESSIEMKINHLRKGLDFLDL